MKLIIAEKPSVGKTIAKAVGACRNMDGYLEGNGYVVSWCFGHLFDLMPPEGYDEKYAKWRLEDLPIIPEKYRYVPVESGKKQIAILRKLMNRDDVTSLIEATDAGREGELIFRLVYYKLGCRKPFERLWISSLEESAIKEGLASLRPSAEYDPLFQAALGRSRADWLYGMNGTRLYSLTGGLAVNGALSVGRVQTPTLAIIVARQKEIDAFVPEEYSVIVCDFDGWKLESERFSDKEKAVRLMHLMKGKPVMITGIEKTEKKTYPPRLFSLTSLQREMNRLHGMTAGETLSTMQELYEARMLSYPRTDSEYITEDMAGRYVKMLGLIRKNHLEGASFPMHVKRVVCNDKVSDHHAVIVTESFASKPGALEGMKEKERKIMTAVMKRMAEAVGEPYEYLETKVTGVIADTEVTGNGTTPIMKGWKEIASLIPSVAEKKKKPYSLPPSSVFPEDLAEGDSRMPAEVRCDDRKTPPPPYFTEDTLLRVMECAGAKEMDDEVERKGLGTSATRAEIIEKLIKRGYVVRERKQLKATPSGCRLIEIVSEGFRSVDTTVAWENRLLDIEKGRGGKLTDFLLDVADEIRKLCDGATEKKAVRLTEPAGTCPVCGGTMRMAEKYVKCQSCGSVLYRCPKFLNGLTLSREATIRLIEGKTVKHKIYSQAKGRWIPARLTLRKPENGKVFFELDISFE